MSANLFGLGLVLLAGSPALAQDPSQAYRQPSYSSTRPPGYYNPTTGNATLLPPPPPSVTGRGWEVAPKPAIQRVALQQPMLDATRGTDEGGEFQINLEPPGPETLFRRESEKWLQERMRQEAKDGKNRPAPERIYFPDEPPISTQTYTGRNFAPMTELVEPDYVCYGRLYFEEKNSERYGWDLGAIGPLVSAAAFFKDVALLPYHIGTEPCRHYDCNAGYCLPGDPVPYLLYPPEFSVTGTVLEGATIGALFIFFPG